MKQQSKSIALTAAYKPAAIRALPRLFVPVLLAALALFVLLVYMACTKTGPGDTPPPPPASDLANYPIPVQRLRVRDPFILKDEASKAYYLNVSTGSGFKTYSSKDLLNWRDDGSSFTPGSDFWGKSDFWAPDTYFYKGKYYIFATFSGSTAKRGTSVLISDKPGGPFQPLVNQAVTPADWMALDGSLYIDDENKPWILYCREWLEVTDGQVVAQRLSEDLKNASGEPVVLFSAGQAGWTGTITYGSKVGYVSDAPFIYRAKNGELLMTWSSFTKTGKYAIGLSRSTSGTIAGPWLHDAAPLNDDDGGHAMLFNDFSGQLTISYHAPNSLTEHAVVYKVSENNGKLLINK
ncbi:glycoside hydrolase family 43 protein [Pedobacter sp. SYP-B3415]|uniref:glycoside hydrolase family 43 protein n=1 Tax=Pedobacter sp. SYP-B3415 TaxID=2496641 RepID=UPI00101DDC2A|nr:glycoside hydrolase family 43 protein [Pedobacter sp. SYP-B3415]